jgi:hypothetical protein
MRIPADNSTSNLRTSAFRGDPWAAFDRLPPAPRRALHEAVIDWCPLQERWLLNKRLKAGMTPEAAVAEALELLRHDERAEIALFAGHWPARLGRYPHVGANATVSHDERRACGRADAARWQPHLPAPRGRAGCRRWRAAFDVRCATVLPPPPNSGVAVNGQTWRRGGQRMDRLPRRAARLHLPQNRDLRLPGRLRQQSRDLTRAGDHHSRETRTSWSITARQPPGDGKVIKQDGHRLPAGADRKWDAEQSAPRG